jgi:hypothetical protein
MRWTVLSSQLLRNYKIKVAQLETEKSVVHHLKEKYLIREKKDLKSKDRKHLEITNHSMRRDLT